MDRCDIVIVGAGPIGAGLAAALADTPFTVTLLDPGAMHAEWPALGDGSVNDYDSRVSAINERSRGLLESLGIWNDIAEQRLCALAQVRVWDGQGHGTLDFDAAALGAAPAIGYVVENRLLTTAALRRVQRSDNIQTLPATAARGIARVGGAGDVGVLTDNGDTVMARLVVLADGGRSPLRELAGFKVWRHDYRQCAVVATVRTEREHENTAWQRFLATGPLAFLPLGSAQNPANGQHMSSIVWTLGSARAETVAAMSDAAFSDALTHAFEARLGQTLDCGERRRFPLRHCQAIRYAQHGVALIGDTAHAVHPLAGQGINFGLHDVAVLAAELRRSGPGPVALESYERQRRAHNMLAGAVLDGIRLSFAAPQPAAGWLREAGMRSIDRMPALKRFLARQAMGV